MLLFPLMRKMELLLLLEQTIWEWGRSIPPKPTEQTVATEEPTEETPKTETTPVEQPVLTQNDEEETVVIPKEEVKKKKETPKETKPTPKKPQKPAVLYHRCTFKCVECLL